MRTSGLFTIHAVKILAKHKTPISLVFFGDVHWDSPNHARDEWKRFLDHARGLKNAYFIGMGDYLDSTSTSERGCLGRISQDMHETYLTDIQRLQMDKVEAFAKDITFMRGRILGILNGNHYFNFADGTNTDQQLCRLLGCKYLGASSFVRLTMEVNSKRKAFDIWLHHGAGAGRLIGSSINRVEQMAEYADADCYAMGDDHARLAVPGQPRFSLGHTKNGVALRTKRPFYIRSGSFLKAYEPGKVSYVVDRARGPRNLGHVELEITPLVSSQPDQSPIELEIHGIS